MSLASNQDGYLERLAGGRSTWKFSLAAGGAGLIDLAFSGADAGHAAETLLEDVDYEDTDPPVFVGGLVTLDEYTPTFSSIEVDSGVQLAQREDPTKSGGVLSYALTSRKVTGSLVIEMPEIAACDLATKQKAGTEICLDIQWGTTPARYRCHIPRLQILDIDKGNKDGLVNVTLQFQANGDMEQNNDIVFAQL